jgi:hypothetical protein
MKLDARVKLIQTVVALVILIVTILWTGFTNIYTNKLRLEKIPRMERQIKELAVDSFCSQQMLEAMAKKILTEQEFQTLKVTAESEKQKILSLFPNGDK